VRGGDEGIAVNPDYRRGWNTIATGISDGPGRGVDWAARMGHNARLILADDPTRDYWRGVLAACDAALNGERLERVQ
jgi:hypothetical protein